MTNILRNFPQNLLSSQCNCVIPLLRDESFFHACTFLFSTQPFESSLALASYSVEQLLADGEDTSLERVGALLLESFEEVFRVSASQAPLLEEAFLDED